jgi:DNA-binding Lrp family transcriptional regulator
MMGDWTFFSNHGHVFFCLARNGDARLRDVAADVGITERAVQKIVKDLQQAGYIEVRKQGRCNRYRINRRKSLRHPLEAHCSVSKVVNLVAPGARAAAVTTMPAVEDPVVAAPAAVRAEAEPEPESRPERPPEPDIAPGTPAEAVAAIPPAGLTDDSPADAPAAEDAAKVEGRDEAGQGKRKGKRKREATTEPIDIRQQRSLF